MSSQRILGCLFIFDEVGQPAGTGYTGPLLGTPYTTETLVSTGAFISSEHPGGFLPKQICCPTWMDTPPARSPAPVSLNPRNELPTENCDQAFQETVLCGLEWP